MPANRKLQNAVATALIADATLKALPQSRPQWSSRVTMLSQAISRAYGLPFADVKAQVRQQIITTHGYDNASQLNILLSLP